MSNILDHLAHPDWSRQALASGAAGRSLPATVTNLLAVGPARTVEAINESPTPSPKVADLLARHQPDRSPDQWRGVLARDEHERIDLHRDPQFVLYRHTLRPELDDVRHPHHSSRTRLQLDQHDQKWLRESAQRGGHCCREATPD